jgi:hypothetical protein
VIASVSVTEPSANMPMSLPLEPEFDVDAVTHELVAARTGLAGESLRLASVRCVVVTPESCDWITPEILARLGRGQLVNPIEGPVSPKRASIPTFVTLTAWALSFSAWMTRTTPLVPAKGGTTRRRHSCTRTVVRPS